MSALINSVQYYTGDPSQCNKVRKRMKRSKTVAKHVFPPPNDMIVYVENLNYFTKQLELLSDFGKVTRYMIIIPKSIKKIVPKKQTQLENEIENKMIIVA